MHVVTFERLRSYVSMARLPLQHYSPRNLPGNYQLMAQDNRKLRPAMAVSWRSLAGMGRGLGSWAVGGREPRRAKTSWGEARVHSGDASKRWWWHWTLRWGKDWVWDQRKAKWSQGQNREPGPMTKESSWCKTGKSKMEATDICENLYLHKTPARKIKDGGVKTNVRSEEQYAGRRAQEKSSRRLLEWSRKITSNKR